VRPLRRVRAGPARQGSPLRLLPPTGCGAICPRPPTDLVPNLPPPPGGVCLSISVGYRSAARPAPSAAGTTGPASARAAPLGGAPLLNGGDAAGRPAPTELGRRRRLRRGLAFRGGLLPARCGPGGPGRRPALRGGQDDAGLPLGTSEHLAPDQLRDLVLE